MGMIQGSINNLLTTAAVATRLSPELEAKAKVRGELALQKQKLKSLEEQTKIEGDTNIEDLQKKSEILSNIYELDPTTTNLKNVGDAEYEVSKAVRGEQYQEFTKKFTEDFVTSKPSRARAQQQIAKKKADEALRMEQERISRGGTV